jgi:competence protein ComEC
LLILVILTFLKFNRPFYAGIAAFLACLSWQYSAYQSAQQSVLVSAQPLTGTIVGTPQHFAEYSQFQLLIGSGPAKDYRLKLSWFKPQQQVRQGQQWQLYAKLRPVAGVANPGAVNKEAMALLNNIVAQGSVSLAPSARLLAQPFSVRPFLLDKMSTATKDLASGPLLIALTLGERQFSATLWRGLQQSGLAHLVAISGLHIGLVFGWGLLLLRLIPWPLPYLPYQRIVALLGAMVLCCSYAWLAGFSVPTVRAAVALLLFVVALLQNKALSSSGYWLLLCALLLLVQPFFLLSKSFWLSMLALAIIFFVLWLQPPVTGSWRSRFCAFLRFHLHVTLFMSLLSLLMFNGSTPLMLLSNLVFIPWCSLLAIPFLLLCLLAELIAVAGREFLWQWCDLVFQPLLWWLQWCAESDSWWVLPELSLPLLLGLIILLLWYYLNSQRLLWCLSVVLAVPLLALLMRPAPWQLHLIDVGQGLAVLLQHGHRGVLYDVGPRYGAYSATATQVLPYLRQRGVTQLDYLLLSHDDSDHTGDWQLIAAAYPGVQVYSDIGHIDATGSCRQLPPQYLAAQLQVLDGGSSFSSKNDNSCVLLISLYDWKLLLPGDISQRVEQQLLQRYPGLQANVLILAHHGSNSSSHLAFLSALAPQLALNSASMYNRHQHPAWAVQQRLALLGIPLINTAQHGALRLDISAEKLSLTPFRTERIPFWLQKPIGNAETFTTTR